MAIPLYSNPQVQDAPIEGARLDPRHHVVNPTGAIGQGLSNEASGFQQINHEADVMRVTDAFTPLETDESNIVLSARQIKGKQVVDPNTYGGEPGVSLTDTALANFDKAVQARSEGLTASQKVLFDMAAKRKRVGLQAQVQSHETQQSGVMKNQIYQDRDSVLADTISKLGVKDGYPDGEVIKSNLADRVDNARRWAASQGLDVDLAEQAVKSGSYTSVINNLIAAKKPDAALGFYSEHKMELDEKTRLHLGELIENQAQAANVLKLRRQVDALNLPLKERLAWVNEKAGDNPDLYANLRAAVLQSDNDVKVAKGEEVGTHTESVAKNLGAKSTNFAAAINSPEMATFRTQYPKEAADLTADYRQSLHALVTQDEASPATRYEQQAAYFEAIRHPERFIGKNPKEIGALWHTYGPYTAQLQEHALGWVTPKKAAEAKVDAQDINAALYDLKIDPLKDKEKATRFQQFLETAVDAAQHLKAARPGGGDGTLDRSEKQKLIEEAKKKITYFDPGFFGGSNEEGFPWEMTPEQMTVPPADRAEAGQVLKDNGILNPTKFDAWQAWQAVLQARTRAASVPAVKAPLSDKFGEKR